MKLSDFDYELPEELIAQYPAEKRDGSRLLVYNRETKEHEHRHFYDITEYLKPGDCLVINDTRVLPMRLLGHNEVSGGAMELLLLKRREGDVWETLARPGKRAIPGKRFVFGDAENSPEACIHAEVREVLPDGNRLVQLEYRGVFEEALERVGSVPLPPYIKASLADRSRYQTVYAVHNGSAAAPTAGFHFTPELLERVQAMGVDIARITLHVGLGTFRPVKEDDIEKHEMHTEYYEVSPEAAEKLNAAKARGGRVICVGTTSCRTIESAADETGHIAPCCGNTSIFIYPGYKFKLMDGLITNFHLPKSTLIMLVSAFAGREEVLALYNEAVRERYRFFSFGDAMLLY